MLKKLITSESVTEGHPDKICDQISDAILDSIMENEYSCAVTPQVRQTGNRLSGLAGTAYASLLT